MSQIPHPVTVLSGSDDFRRQRAVRKYISWANTEGWRLVQVSAGDMQTLESALSSPMLLAEKTLVLCEGNNPAKRRKKDADTEESDTEDSEDWGKEDHKVLVDFAKLKDEDVCVVVVHVGEVKATSFTGKLVKEKVIKHNTFTAPTFWELTPHAVDFLLSEVASQGKKMDRAVAEQVVQYVGTDLGTLAYEAVKYVTYLRAVGGDEVTFKIAARLLASFGATDTQTLLDAIGTRNVKAVMAAMNDIRKGPVASRGVMVLARTIGTMATQWLMVAALMERDMSVKDIADRLGKKSFYVEKQIAIARRWGVNGLTNLIRGMTRADRSQSLGHISPWTEIEVELIRACDPQLEPAR